MKLKEHMWDEEQKALEFAEKERKYFLQNGEYSSASEIGHKDYSGGKISYHWNPKLCQVVVIDTWAVANGPDDVDYEFEIKGTIGRVSELVDALK